MIKVINAFLVTVLLIAAATSAKAESTNWGESLSNDSQIIEPKLDTPPVLQRLYFANGLFAVNFQSSIQTGAEGLILGVIPAEDIKLKDIYSSQVQMRLCVVDQCEPWVFGVLQLDSTMQYRVIDYWSDKHSGKKTFMASMKKVTMELAFGDTSESIVPTHYIDIGAYCDQYPENFLVDNVIPSKKGCHF